MIDVTLHDTAGIVATAEADDPESALVAARTLWDDHRSCYAGKLRLEIAVAGRIVYTGSTIEDVVRSLGAAA